MQSNSPKRKGIAALRHKVRLCSQSDVITTEGGMQLRRKGVWSAWAGIEAKKASMFSREGAAMKESRDAHTHVGTLRYRDDLNISALAWLYEERLKSSPRWFKVLAVNQTEQGGTPCFMLDLRLVERGDDIARPIEEDTPERHGPAMSLPHGVKL